MENRHDAQFRPQAEGVVMSAAPQPTAIQRWLIAVIAAFSILSLAMSGPAQAHEKKKHEQAQRAEQAKRAQQHVQQQGQSTTTPQGKAAAHDTAEMMDDMGMEMDRSQMSFFERIYSWFGRLHPLIVHFPIAFFPAALFTAIVGRKRPAFAAPVQFLVVAGGIFAPIAAAAGWLAGLGADPDPHTQLPPLARRRDRHRRSGTWSVGVEEAVGGPRRRDDPSADADDPSHRGPGIPRRRSHARHGPFDVLRRT
jgi:hypothetical protein